MADITKALIHYVEKMEGVPPHKQHIVKDLLTALKESPIKDSEETRRNACYLVLIELPSALSDQPGVISKALLTPGNLQRLSELENALELTKKPQPSPRSK